MTDFASPPISGTAGLRARTIAMVQPDPVGQTASNTSHVLFTILLSIVVTAFPIAAFIAHPLLAILGQMLLVTGVVLFFTPVAPLVIVFALIFQNLFVSFFSGFVPDSQTLNILKGFNFLTMMICWLWLFGHYAMNWRNYAPAVNRIMAVGLIAFGLIALYFVLGLAKNPMGAAIYLRNIITPMVMFQIFFLTSMRFSQPIMPFFVTITIFVILLGWFEALDREAWMNVTNGWPLWKLGMAGELDSLAWDKLAKEKGQVITGILHSMEIQFLNTPLLADYKIIIKRLNGPNVHAISYAYLLAFLVLIMTFSSRWYYFIPILPLMLLASAKGSFIMIFLAGCALLARKLFGAVFGLASLIFVLLVYILAGIVVGLDIGDYHVLGFMGGVYGFLGNPIGYGLGDGGNLATKFHELDWSAYQAAGRTPVAMESSVGVMLHQMGIATFALLACYIWIAIQTYKVSLKSQVALHSVAAFALLIIIVNGIFQEEAIFSPLALGMIMGLNGQILGASLRFCRLKR